MLEYIRKLWKIDDLRKKIVYTFLMLVLFRLVGCIPAPGIDLTRLGMGGNNLPLLDMMNMMTGGAMSQMTIMAMGISPYINASIIMQLLCIALPFWSACSRKRAAARRSTASIATSPLLWQ